MQRISFKRFGIWWACLVMAALVIGCTIGDGSDDDTDTTPNTNDTDSGTPESTDDTNSDDDSDTTPQADITGTLFENCLSDHADAVVDAQVAATGWSETSASVITYYEAGFTSSSADTLQIYITMYEEPGGLTEAGTYDIDEALITGLNAPVYFSVDVVDADDNRTEYLPVPGSGTLTLENIAYNEEDALFAGCIDALVEEQRIGGDPCQGTVQFCWSEPLALDAP